MKANLVLPYMDMNTLSRLAKETHAQMAEISTYNATSVTNYTLGTGPNSISLGSFPVDSNPETAIEILAIAWSNQMIPYANQASGTSGIAAYEFDTEFRLSYHQPSPPAPTATKNADTTGTLALYNIFWRNFISLGSVWTANGHDTSGDTQIVTPPAVQETVIFEKPPRFVGSSVYVNARNSSLSFAVVALTRCYVLYRPVKITTAEYVNLVAIASGQAILPATILG